MTRCGSLKTKAAAVHRPPGKCRLAAPDHPGGIRRGGGAAGLSLFPEAALRSAAGVRDAPRPGARLRGSCRRNRLRERPAPQTRPNLFLRPQAAFLTPSKRGASGPTISFVPHSAQRCGDPFLFHRLWSPEVRAPCVGRRTCGAAQMGRGGFAARDGAAWWYQRKIVGARMPVALPEAEMRPDTPRSLS